MMDRRQDGPNLFLLSHFGKILIITQMLSWCYLKEPQFWVAISFKSDLEMSTQMEQIMLHVSNNGIKINQLKLPAPHSCPSTLQV